MSETSITWISEDRRWKVWTDNTAHAARIERTFGIAPYRVDAQGGYPDGKFYLLPEGMYRPFVAKRQLTDAQRAEMAERFKLSTGLGENTAISGDSDEIEEMYLDEIFDDSSPLEPHKVQP